MIYLYVYLYIIQLERVEKSPKNRFRSIQLLFGESLNIYNHCNIKRVGTVALQLYNLPRSLV